jgi:hypothetical protein
MRDIARSVAIATLAAVIPCRAAAEGVHSGNAGYPVESHTVAVLEGGILTLPSAPISPANRGGATPIGAVGNGDATAFLGALILYRANPYWALGAAVDFAPKPTSDRNYGDASGLSRTHTRSYLTLDGEIRYFPIHSQWFEPWVGLSAGAVIVADRFTTNAGEDVPPILGTKSVTVSTQGFVCGIKAGADYLLTQSWVIGLALGASDWILPGADAEQASCDSIGDCPTLKGNVASFDFGLTIGYRIPL